jgi:hypothetical protein
MKNQLVIMFPQLLKEVEISREPISFMCFLRHQLDLCVELLRLIEMVKNTKDTNFITSKNIEVQDSSTFILIEKYKFFPGFIAKTLQKSLTPRTVIFSTFHILLYLIIYFLLTSVAITCLFYFPHHNFVIFSTLRILLHLFTFYSHQW